MLNRPAARRRDFPSWSWAGWMSAASWPMHLTWPEESIMTVNTLGPEVKLQIELPDGKCLSWDTFHQRYSELEDTSLVSQFLYVSAWHVQVRVTSGDEQSTQLGSLDMKGGYYLTWSLSLKDTPNLVFRRDAEEPLSTQAYAGLILGTGPRELFIVIIGQVNGTMERLAGVLVRDHDHYVPGWGCTLHSPDGGVVGAPGKGIAAVVERCKENWHQDIVSTYQTVKLG
jgi:hypothetical protein